MNQLEIKNIRLRAKHGCMPQEKNSLGDFSVDISFWGDFQEAILKDELKAAIDYVEVTDLVIEEMAIASKLIEHVAGRIADRCLEKFSQAQRVRVSLSKHKPPVNHLSEVIIHIERSP